MGLSFLKILVNNKIQLRLRCQAYFIIIIIKAVNIINVFLFKKKSYTEIEVMKSIFQLQVQNLITGNEHICHLC